LTSLTHASDFSKSDHHSGALDIDFPLKTVPYVALSHPAIERQIAAIRGEFLGHLPFWKAVISDGNCCSSRNTTTGTVFIEDSEAQYPIPGRRTWIKTSLAWTITDGNPAVAACTSYPSPLDYEFATH
jgi:hypothetical protein